jgi:hypothetical protein
MAADTKDLVLKWYYRGQLDYFDIYINLFISYNAWFKKVTELSEDRAAIERLKTRTGIWDEYLAGNAMHGLDEPFAEIAAITQAEPLKNLTGGNRHWDGIVKNDSDWQGLIEYWYRIRCNLFHGTKSPEDDREVKLVKLAHESLNVFMSEIVSRMEGNFSKDSMYRLYEIGRLRDSTERSLKANKYSDAPARQADVNYLQDLNDEDLALMNRLYGSKNLWEVDL